MLMTLRIALKKIGLLLVFMGVGLAGCDSSPSANTEQPGKPEVVTIRPRPHQNRLLFNGYIQPFSSMTVTAPTDGILIKKLFAYGQTIRQGQSLFVIESEKLDSDYQAALSGYIKAVETYQNNQVKWEGTEALNKSGLISRNDYLAAKNSLADSLFNLQQARQKLKKLLDMVQEKPVDLRTLASEPTSALLNKLKNSVKQMTVRAPRAGVALFATEEQKKAHEAPGKQAGNVVKANDPLLMIGDTSKLSMTVEVNERDIAQLKPGQKAQVNSSAIPNLVMQGVVAHVSQQATLSIRGMPKFSARIDVLHLTPQQKQQVHVGMSVTIVVQLDQHTDMMAPIEAVKYDKQHRAWITHPNGTRTRITPGRTTANSVVIEQGIKQGEKIVRPTHTPAR